MVDLFRRRATGHGRPRGWVIPAVAAGLIVLGTGGAFAYSSSGDSARAGVARATTPTVGSGAGLNEYGMATGSYDGHPATFVFTHGFFCDRHVTAASASGCEVGAAAAVPPVRDTGSMIITIPLVSDGQNMDCPDDLICVDHPANLDMTRLATKLAPFAKTTTATLIPRLRNVTTVGHDQFIAGANADRPQWWNVRVIGVSDPVIYRAIQQHHSWAYLQALLKNKDEHLVGPFPTNLFLYFADTGRRR